MKKDDISEILDILVDSTDDSITFRDVIISILYFIPLVSLVFLVHWFF